MQPQAGKCETWLGVAWMHKNMWKYSRCLKYMQNPAKSTKRAQCAPRPLKILQKLPNAFPKPSQNPPQTHPKPSPNPLKIAILSKKSNFAFWDPFWTPDRSTKPRQDPPKRSQNPQKIHEKSMTKKARLFGTFFKGFPWIFDLKIHWFWHAFRSLFLSKCQTCKT